MKRGIVLGAVIVVAVLVGACRPHKFAGSCDMRSSSASGSQLCIDFYSSKNIEAVKAICAAYTWNATPCDHTGALVGCRDDKEIEWHYKSSVDSSAASVSCMSGMKQVDTKWVEKEDK
jgi:hypothetical protein